MQNILISAYFFYPEIAPRAFRTFELAKALSKLGYKIDIVIPENTFNYSDIEKQYNITVIKVRSGFFFNKSKQVSNTFSNHTQTKSFKNIIKHFIKPLMRKLFYCIYIGGKSFEYGFTLYSFLKTQKKYDGVISIGLPISVHFGTALYLQKNKNIKASIADYGDPFSFNKEIPSCFFYPIFERYTLKIFSYISVPVESAVEKFLSFKLKNDIVIIPQGYDFSTLKIAPYSKNTIVTFGYAGIFYKKIRNPKILFDFLISLKIDFKFILYTDINNQENMSMVEPYCELLGNKLIINNLIPREECIYNLSMMDFIINQDNLFSEQIPSKLIDYMVTMRPIFSYTQKNFDAKKFLSFLESPQTDIDALKLENSKKLQQFDAINVAKQFINLLNDKI